MIRISLLLLAAILTLAACPKGNDEHDHTKGAHDPAKDEHGHAVDEHGHGKGEHEREAKTTAASLAADGGTR
jgi:hypothetical protein